MCILNVLYRNRGSNGVVYFLRRNAPIKIVMYFQIVDASALYNN